jgi:hypothetical protein
VQWQEFLGSAAIAGGVSALCFVAAGSDNSRRIKIKREQSKEFII